MKKPADWWRNVPFLTDSNALSGLFSAPEEMPRPRQGHMRTGISRNFQNKTDWSGRQET